MHISVIFIYNSPSEDVLSFLGAPLSETQMERHRKKEIPSIFQKHWICYNNLCCRNVLARLLINATKCFTLKWVNKSRVTDLCHAHLHNKSPFLHEITQFKKHYLEYKSFRHKTLRRKHRVKSSWFSYLATGSQIT